MAFKFPVAMNRLHEMLEAIKKEAVMFSPSKEAIKDIELASEEALVNIIHYSGLSIKDLIEIDVNGVEHSQVTIKICDSGRFYDPLDALKNRKEDPEATDGYGIFLISRLMDALEYRQEDGKNAFILIKHLK